MTLDALPEGLAELETLTKGEGPGELGGSALGDLEAFEKGGPYIGPKGGKWADPQHTVSWDEKIHGAGKKQGDLFGGGEGGEAEKKKTTQQQQDQDRAKARTSLANASGNITQHGLAALAHEMAADSLGKTHPEEAAKHKAQAEIHHAKFKELEAAKKPKPAGGGESGGANGRPSARELVDAPEGANWELRFKDGRHLEVRRDSEGYSIHDLTAVSPSGGAPVRKTGLAPHDVAELMSQAEKVKAGKKPAGGGEKKPEGKGDLPVRASTLAGKATKEAMDAAAAHGAGVQVNDPFHRKAMAEAHRHAEAAHRQAAKLHAKAGNDAAVRDHTRQEKAHRGMAEDHEAGVKRAEKEASEAEAQAREKRAAGDPKAKRNLHDPAVFDPKTDKAEYLNDRIKEHMLVAGVDRDEAELVMAHAIHDGRKFPNKEKMTQEDLDAARKLGTGKDSPPWGKVSSKSLPGLDGLAALTKSKPIPLPASGKASSIASMRAAQGVDSEGNAKKGEQIPGGLASGKTPADFPAEALAAGTKVEMEHTKDAKVAREIAMDHLTEDPAYYEKLARMESKEKSMATENTGLNGLAQFAGTEPLKALPAPAGEAPAAEAPQGPRIHLVKGVDCNHQPQEATAHARAVVRARVDAERNAAVTLGVPGPAPAAAAAQAPVGVAYLAKGGDLVPYASRADQEAAELVKSGAFNHAEPPRFPTTNLVARTCPACGGHLIKALTACPHCNTGRTEQPVITERQERPEPPAVRTTGPLLQPAREVVVDARNGLPLNGDE